MPRGCRSVSAVALDENCQYAYAADMSDNYSIHVYDLTVKDKRYGRPTPVCAPKSSNRL
jgi:hypothetical protein